MINSLKQFQNRYLVDTQTFMKESEMIRKYGYLPDDLSHRWQLDIACIDETLRRENGYISEEVCGEYLDTLIDFLRPRYDLLVDVEDYYNAFDISYCSFFACIENVSRSCLDSNPTWKAFETEIMKTWKELFLQLSEDDVSLLWSIFWGELEALFLSGVYRKIPIEPYFHFLSLPWPEKYKLDTEDKLNYFRDSYGFIYDYLWYDYLQP